MDSTVELGSLPGSRHCQNGAKPNDSHRGLGWKKTTLNKLQAVTAAVLATATLSFVSACGGATNTASTAGGSATSLAVAGLSSDCQKFLALFQEGSSVVTADVSTIQQYASKVKAQASSFSDQNLRDAATSLGQYYEQSAAYKATPKSAKIPDSNLINSATNKMGTCIKH